MPTDTVRAATPAVSFALRLIAWSLALFGLLRLTWIEAHVLLPITQLQVAAGAAWLGPSMLPIEASLACSGADALALCLAAIAAYPAPWRMRAVGWAIGAAGLLVVNIIRIGTLGRAAASPARFEALHVYVWPAVLAAAIAAFVYSWMRAADRQRPAHRTLTDRTAPEQDWRVTGRFVFVAATLLILFTLASPLYLESARLLAVAGVVAQAAALLLREAGVAAVATSGVIATPRGAFLVTRECLATPLIPVYLAAVIVYSQTWWTSALWTAVGVPLFVGLGIARLLVVAVPAGIEMPPAFFIHAFFQLLVAAGMVCGFGLWRHGVRAATWVRVLAALALGIAFLRLFGSPYTHAIQWLSVADVPVNDPQGALMFLPAFQFGLFLALWIAAFTSSGWTRFVSGAALLTVLQVAVAGSVQLLAVQAGIGPAVRDIRAWALLGPALVLAVVVNRASPRR